MVLNRRLLLSFGIVAVTLCAVGQAQAADASSSIDFADDIRPILAEHCYRCHGPDAATREAELRLDESVGLFEKTADGKPLIARGDRSRSEMFRRIVSDDAEVRMPPVEAELSLTQSQIAAIGKWIDEGAAWQQHWAYRSPRRPPLPALGNSNWGRGPIDVFTSRRMADIGLSPSSEADRRTLIRRVTLDLTGLPPTPEEIDTFLVDTRPGAFERVVDRLLQSPRFGERMATPWLDLARYADTHGYHMDAHRDMWRWRDWVIDAFNDNMYFDQFTIEQLAGDLLPGATLSQRIATGFNRNNMVNFENGVIADEFLAEYAIDRVTTTSTTWLGQTMICARCHDHKYDPISQRDFYRLFAFFNQVPENGVDGSKGNAAPFISAPLPHQVQRLEALQKRVASLELQQQQRAAEVDEAIKQWETQREPRDSGVVVPKPVFSIEFEEHPQQLQPSIEGNVRFVPGKSGNALLFDGSTHLQLESRSELRSAKSFTISMWIFPTTRGSSAVLEHRTDGPDASTFFIGLDRGRVVVRSSSARQQVSTYLASDLSINPFKWHHLSVRSHNHAEQQSIEVFINGKLIAMSVVDEPNREDRKAEVGLTIGSQQPEFAFRGMMDEMRVFSRALSDDELATVAGGDPIGDILAIERTARTDMQSERLKQYYLQQVDNIWQEITRQLEAARIEVADFQANIPTTMVMQELADAKPTHVLNRGRYDLPGDLVAAGVPSIFAQLPESEPANRLSLARWLVQQDNPLTARVAVNRLWQQLFGAGFVRTPEDFGTRGELPTHPELLDWLATEFASDWDVKRLIRMIVTSATYRQSSHATPEQVSRDPDNRWLARSSRIRLNAEAIRDSALFASGLLVERIGGPGVFPYQPDGLWEEIAFNANDYTAQVYRQSRGEDLFRRSIYTFVKRSLPSATIAVFDLPNRETCIASRSRTNTPQQALVLMNDLTFIEAARALAQETLAACKDEANRLDRMFVAATSRIPTREERTELTNLIKDLQREYSNQQQLAEGLVSAGESPVNSQLDVNEVAVWTAIANVVVSLDEAITRP